MRVLFASDHAGENLKASLMSFVEGLGHDVDDVDMRSHTPDDDYPDFIGPLAKKVLSMGGRAVGIAVGGSGQGEAMVANRAKGIRAAVYYGGILEIIRLSRDHNDANVLCLGARFLTEHEAKRAVSVWLETPFSGDARHVRRHKKF